ncbi:MAG: DUF2116 family Zn-ribbon domain-containing protein [Nanoarchaeota archaeon]
MFRNKSNKVDHKFCPACGLKLKIEDTFCVKCGYSFAERVKKKSKINKVNTIIFLTILVVAYFGLRYANGQTWIPTSFADALRTILPIK